MDPNLLKGYGLIRSVLGAVILTGFVCGYHALEFLLAYPPSQDMPRLDQDTIALIYAVGFLRGLFHLIVGWRICRHGRDTRWWVWIGWPGILLVTVGLDAHLLEVWQQAGVVSTWAAGINWIGVLCYAALVVIDTAILPTAIRAVRDARRTVAMRLWPWTAVTGAAVLMALGAVLLAGPVESGFHRGFYKLGDESLEPAPSLRVGDAPRKGQASSMSPPVGAQKGQPIEYAYPVTPVTQHKVTESSPPTWYETRMDPQDDQMAFSVMWGIAGAIVWLVALGGLLMAGGRFASVGQARLFWGLMTASFAMWGVYGYLVQAVVLLGGAAIAAILSILLMLVSREEE